MGTVITAAIAGAIAASFIATAGITIAIITFLPFEVLVWAEITGSAAATTQIFRGPAI